MHQDPLWSGIPVILTVDDELPEDFGSIAGPPLVAQLQKPYRLEDLLDELQACTVAYTPNSVGVVVKGGNP